MLHFRSYARLVYNMCKVQNNRVCQQVVGVPYLVVQPVKKTPA